MAQISKRISNSFYRHPIDFDSAEINLGRLFVTCLDQVPRYLGEYEFGETLSIVNVPSQREILLLTVFVLYFENFKI